MSTLILPFPDVYSFQGLKKLWLLAPLQQPDFLLCLLYEVAFVTREVWRLSRSQIWLEIWACSLLACFPQEKWTKNYFCIIFLCHCAFLDTIFAGSFYAFQWRTHVSSLPRLKQPQSCPSNSPSWPPCPAGPARGALLLFRNPDSCQTATSLRCAFHLLPCPQGPQ